MCVYHWDTAVNIYRRVFTISEGDTYLHKSVDIDTEWDLQVLANLLGGKHTLVHNSARGESTGIEFLRPVLCCCYVLSNVALKPGPKCICVSMYFEYELPAQHLNIVEVSEYWRHSHAQTCIKWKYLYVRLQYALHVQYLN